MRRKCQQVGTRAVSILGSTPTIISEKKIIASINPNSDQWKGSMHAAPGSSSTLIIKKKTTWKGVATSSPTGSTHLLLNSIAFDLVACLIPEAPCHSKVWDWRRNKNIHVSGSSIASMHLGNWGSWKERTLTLIGAKIRGQPQLWSVEIASTLEQELFQCSGQP